MHSHARTCKLRLLFGLLLLGLTSAFLFQRTTPSTLSSSSSSRHSRLPVSTGKRSPAFSLPSRKFFLFPLTRGREFPLLSLSLSLSLVFVLTPFAYNPFRAPRHLPLQQ
jgi:hypothetical protein